MKQRIYNLSKAFAVAVAMTLGVAGAVQAETANNAPPGSAAPQLSPELQAKVEAFREKRTELMKLGQELEKIRQETVTKHPDLKQQEEKFGDMVAAEMKKNGGTPKEDLAELRSLQAKLRDEKTPDADRQALMMRLQRKAQEFDQARRQALQNPELQQAQGKLLQDMVGAMKKENPRTDDLMKQMHQKQQEMIEIRNEAQAEQSKSQDQSPGK